MPAAAGVVDEKGSEYILAHTGPRELDGHPLGSVWVGVWFNSRLYYPVGKGPGQHIIRCLKNKKCENEPSTQQKFTIYIINLVRYLGGVFATQVRQKDGPLVITDIPIPQSNPSIQIHPLQNNIHVSKVHCGSAFAPGASGLPYYCKPPLCVPDVLGALAVCRHTKKIK